MKSAQRDERLADYLSALTHFFQETRNTIAVTCGTDFRIKKWNRAFEVCCVGKENPDGRSLFDFLKPVDGMVQGPASLMGKAWVQMEAEISKLPFSGFFYAVGERILLLCEPRSETDEIPTPEETDTLGVLAQLTMEVNTLSRQLLDLEEELERSEQKIGVLARTDSLTGTYNRRHFRERIHEMVSASLRHGHQLSVIMCDLDHFRLVNENLGYDMGDRLLKGFADLLKAGCRKEDLVFRFGGEEFLMLLPFTNVQSAAELAERLRARFKDSDILENGQVCTASFGVAGLRLDEQVDSLLKRVEMGLFQAKERGRDQVWMAE